MGGQAAVVDVPVAPFAEGDHRSVRRPLGVAAETAWLDTEDRPNVTGLGVDRVDRTTTGRAVAVDAHEQDLGAIRRPPGGIGGRHGQAEIPEPAAVGRRDQDAGKAVAGIQAALVGDQELRAIGREVVEVDARDWRGGVQPDSIGAIGSGDVHQARARVAHRLPLEGDVRPVPRPAGIAVGLGARDDRGRDARHGVDGVDVARGGVGHEAVGRSAEWLRHLVSRADDQRGAHCQRDEEQREDGRDP